MKKTTLFIAIIAVIVLGGIGIGGYVFYNNFRLTNQIVDVVNNNQSVLRDVDDRIETSVNKLIASEVTDEDSYQLFLDNSATVNAELAETRTYIDTVAKDKNEKRSR